MDQFLADYYGTGATDSEPYADNDIEKMAQLTLLTKEAAAEGIDLNQFSDEEILAMAEDLYGNGSAQGVDMEKEAAAKFEEADFLGRVMAHSFNQELGEIEKQANWAGDAARKTWGAIKGVAGKAREKTTGRVGKAVQDKLDSGVGDRAQGLVHAVGGARQKPGRELYNIGRTPRSADTWEKGKRRLAGAAEAATAAAGVGAAGGVGYGGYKGVKALQERGREHRGADSAFEQLVIERANEHLAASGLLSKTAGDEDFETTVDRAALELLEANGYPVEWY